MKKSAVSALLLLKNEKKHRFGTLTIKNMKKVPFQHSYYKKNEKKENQNINKCSD